MTVKNRLISAQFITRRDFLRLSSLGIIASIGLRDLPTIDINHLWGKIEQNNNISEKTDFYKFSERLIPNQQGRVLNSSTDVYDIPSFSGKRLNTYWRDKVVPITDVTVGSSMDSFNVIWYKIGSEGFVHSGEIQPVSTSLNPVIPNIPKGGTAAEVTVPYTDARWAPGENEPVAYRFYYATTYWVVETVSDKSGNPWYAVHDDKWDYMFYVPAVHMRLIPFEEINPLARSVSPDHKRIEVHLFEQVMIAYEFDEPVFMARVSTGAVFSNGDFSTTPGRYMTFHKRSSRHMARGNLAANGYDLPGVPWNSYITEEGIAFHGTYWHNNFGQPRSHGCINMTPQAAKWVYLWTMPTVLPGQEWLYEDYGTSVDII